MFRAQATAEVLAAAAPDPSTARTHVVTPPSGPLTSPTPAAGAAELSYGQAVNAALRRELAERPDVILFGEDIAMPGGVFGVTRGLQGEFGEDRVFDTPIAESAILGAAVGAASGATASLLGSLLRPHTNDTYQNYVSTCLSDRGYRVVGWE